jgi:hypothetical protein
MLGPFMEHHQHGLIRGELFPATTNLLDVSSVGPSSIPEGCSCRQAFSCLCSDTVSSSGGRGAVRPLPHQPRVPVAPVDDQRLKPTLIVKRHLAHSAHPAARRRRRLLHQGGFTYTWRSSHCYSLHHGTIPAPK